MTRVSAPCPPDPAPPIARQACAWAWVGTAKAPSNHARVAAENPSSACALLTGSAFTGSVPLGPSAAIHPVCPRPPTFRSPLRRQSAASPPPVRRQSANSPSPQAPSPELISRPMAAARDPPVTLSDMIRRDTEVRARRRPAPLAAAAVAALLAVLAGCSAHSSPHAAQARTATRSVSPAPSATSLQRATPTQTPAPRPKPAKPSAIPVAPPDAGSKPQTTVQPKTSSRAFKNAVHDIWLAVTTGDPKYALPAFFPEKAYEQVKAIADPQSDWENRLWLDFTLDLAAVHKLIKPGARLTEVNVAPQYFQWIPEGACYNSVGYWHAPGSRVVYKQGGVTHS